MKFIRYGIAGQERPGLVASDGSYRDLSGLVGDITAESVQSAALADLADTWSSLPTLPQEGRLGAPIAGVGNFYAIGLNYADHAKESGMPIPEHPVLFYKATTSICGPNDDIIKPEGSDALDWEVELGIVIGSRAQRVSVEQARSHILGYLTVNDVSERTWQLQRGGGQWGKGKSHETFGPLGPWLVTADEVPNPGELDLWLTVNGEIMQRGNTRTLIFNVDEIVADLSQYLTLMPGDVIITGTPPGVGMGMKPPRYLQRGDVVELEVQGLGRQRQRVV